jgi:signal transduction histidine kinase
VTSFPNAPVAELLAGLPQLARLTGLVARLEGAVDELQAHGFRGAQIVAFGRRLERQNVSRGALPFTFEAELASAGRRKLTERLDSCTSVNGLIHLQANDLALIADFGISHAQVQGGVFLLPLHSDGRAFGCIVFDDHHSIDAAQAAALCTWSEILVSYISNDVRIRHYEELEHLMRSLRLEHDLAGVLHVVVEALANEYGATCEVWRRERTRWIQMDVSPTGQRIKGVDLAPLMTGEEGIVTLGRAVGVPIVVEERLWGAIVLDETALTGERYNFMRNVARHSELALENALAFERHRQFAVESAALSDAGRTLLGYTRIEPLSSAISRLAVELGEAESAALYLEDAHETLQCIGSFPRLATRPVVVTDEELRSAIDDRTSLIERADRLLLLPLGDRTNANEHGTMRGCLAIRRVQDSPAITHETIRLLEAFATLGTLALRNSRLFEEATEANRALAESNAFKDDLLAMFTHDFKGPLTVISGYGELVLDKLTGEERDGVSIILSQVRRLATLADDALALARAQATGFALERTPGELVSFVKDLLKISFGTSADRLVLEPRVAEIALNFDHQALRHILENVVGNALKYSEKMVRVEVLRERNEAAVIVRDNGIGIPADELAHVFGRFARASNARRRGISGSGVGLYIANRLVEEHGGAIFVSSCEGEGSTFEVRLPLTG